jgi:uncharacterized protein YggE
MKTHLAILPVVALIGWGCSDGDTIVASADTREQIRVVGTATVEVTPDMAQVQLGVQTFAETVDLGVAENNRIMASVLEALKKEGLDDSQLRTSAFNVSPKRDYKREGEEQITGYWVNNTVTVTISDIDRTGSLLQTALDAGANRSFGLFFGLSDPTPIEQQARMLAVEDARQRANDLATAAGGTLGKLLVINESSFSGGPVYTRAEADQGQAVVPIELGELQIGARVEVAYGIVD